MPISLLDGISTPDIYIKKCNKSAYKNFLDIVKPDVIHIHTLMGLHREFLEVANEKKIKVIYTSHDYYGLCPKVNLFDYNNLICEGMNNEKCTICCKNALSYKKIYFLQSRTYRILKNTWILKRIRQIGKHKQIKKAKYDKDIEYADKIVDYTELKKYYQSMLEKVDKFHFNSKTAYEMYNKHINIKKYSILPITHNDIKDKRNKKIYCDDEKLKIGYIGSESYAKGYETLINVLDKIEEKGFGLNIYFKVNDTIPNYINIHEPYNYNNMDNVFNKLDVIVIPSNWKETFGFGVIESLSYGCPVICSKNVGASYLIENSGYVYQTKEELKRIIEELCTSKEKLREWNTNIIKKEGFYMNMLEHTKQVINLYS